MSIGYRFSKQLADSFREFGRQGSVAITRAAKAGWKAAVTRNQSFVYTGSLRANWKLKPKKSSYTPKRYGSPEAPRPTPLVPDFNFRITKDKGFSIYNNMKYAEAVENGSANTAAPMLAIPSAKAAIASTAKYEFSKIEVK